MDYVTIKLYRDTRRLLRLIAAQSGEQMVQVMDRLCQEEWLKVSGKREITSKIAPLDDLRPPEEGS